MSTNKVKIYTDKPYWEEIEKTDINLNIWDYDYTPECFVQMYFLANKGFMIKLTSYETEPRATYTKPNSPVCQDSCLEAFINFAPDKADCGYLNFEANANGSLLCEFGEEGGDARKYIIDLGYSNPDVTIFHDEEKWGYEIFVSLNLLNQVYGDVSYHKGSIIKGNFYKCGDKTEKPHYLAAFPIEFAYPSFHRPEFFKEFELV